LYKKRFNIVFYGQCAAVSVNFSYVMASQHILSGPEIGTTKPNTSLGRHLYQSLVEHGNKIALVGVHYIWNYMMPGMCELDEKVQKSQHAGFCASQSQVSCHSK
jgi:hypothetical protein